MENMKRAVIIAAVIEVVAKHGFHGASMSMIANCAGVAAGTAYLHFESKDHLMREAYKELEQRWLSAVMNEYPSQRSVRQRFSHLADRLIRHCMLFPAELLFVDQFLSSPYRRSACADDVLPGVGLRSVVRLFREGMENRTLKKMPQAMLLALACGPAIQVLRAHTAGSVHLNDARISETVKACWDSVSLQEATHIEIHQ